MTVYSLRLRGWASCL